MAEASFQATVAEPLFAGIAAVGEIDGIVRITIRAGHRTFQAEFHTRGRAGCAFFIACDGPATRTHKAVPIAEGHVRTGGVIRLQNLVHDLKEICEPAVTECVLDGQTPLALAKLALLHVRMRECRTN